MILYAVAGFAAIIAGSYIRDDRDKYQHFFVGAMVIFFVMLLVPFAWVTGALRPVTVDATLREWDLALGLDGFAATRWIAAHGLLRTLSPIYDALPLAIALAWTLERSKLMLKAIVVGPILVLPFYLLVPAAGPVYAFSSWPWADGPANAVGWIHPRNCFPSMHLTWALLLALNIKNWRWRWAFIAYAAAMVVVPVVGGEHYFVDMLAAIPFTFAVQKVSDWSKI